MSLLIIILLKGDLKPNIWTVFLLIVNFQYDLCGSPEAQRALQPLLTNLLNLKLYWAVHY